MNCVAVTDVVVGGAFVVVGGTCLRVYGAVVLSGGSCLFIDLLFGLMYCCLGEEGKEERDGWWFLLSSSLLLS